MLIFGFGHTAAAVLSIIIIFYIVLILIAIENKSASFHCPQTCGIQIIYYIFVRFNIWSDGGQKWKTDVPTSARCAAVYSV